MIDRQQALTRLHCKLQNILEMQNSHHTSSTSHTLHHTSSTPVLKLLSSKNVQTCLYTLFKKQQSWYIFGSVSVTDALESKCTTMNTSVSIAFSSLQWVSENQNYWITTKKHFWDVTIFVHWLWLLLPFASLWHFCPHLLHVFKNHVAMPRHIQRSAEMHNSCLKLFITTETRKISSLNNHQWNTSLRSQRLPIIQHVCKGRCSV